FFDRLVARDAHLGGAGSDGAARAADLERRSGMTRAHPRAPVPFEWPTFPAEQVMETDAGPIWPAQTAETARPPAPATPAPPPGNAGAPRPATLPAAYRGAEQAPAPQPPLLVPPAPQAPALPPVPAATRAPAAPRHPAALTARGVRERRAGPAQPAP